MVRMGRAAFDRLGLTDRIKGEDPSREAPAAAKPKAKRAPRRRKAKASLPVVPLLPLRPEPTGPVEIWIEGYAQPKERARHQVVLDGEGAVSKHHSYTPERTERYEKRARHAAARAMAGRSPWTCGVEIEVVIVRRIAASWSKAKKAEALAGRLEPLSKPDLDNVMKGLCDAFNDTLWVDDCRVMRKSIVKIFGEEEGAWVRVVPSVPMDLPSLFERMQAAKAAARGPLGCVPPVRLPSLKAVARKALESVGAETPFFSASDGGATGWDVGAEDASDEG